MIKKVREILRLPKRPKKCDQLRERIEQEKTKVLDRIEELTRMKQEKTVRM